MSVGEEKHQDDWGDLLMAARGSETLVGEAPYEAFQRARVERWRSLASQGVVCLAPRRVARGKVTLQSSELGVTAHSMVSALGIQELVIDCVVANLAPRCAGCDAIMSRPRALEALTLPTEGFVVVAIAGASEEYSLRERCELFGAERAVVAGSLVRIDTLGEESGEPVLCVVEAPNLARVREEAGRWFARGGSELRLLHFIKRDQRGSEIGTVSAQWRCGPCGITAPTPTRLLIADREPCRVCRGAGWLPIERERFAACRDCDGYGSLSPVARYEFCGVELRDVAALRWSELLRHLEALTCEPTRQLANFTREICESGFGDYPLGAPVELLSVGERATLTILAGRLSKVTGASFVCDVAVTDITSARALPSAIRDNVVVIAPRPAEAISTPRTTAGSRVATLRNICRGPLSLSEVTIPIGGMTAICGPTGAGASLLLHTIAERFARKRRVAHENDFGSLRRVSTIMNEGCSDESVLSLLGVETDLAHEIGRLRVAKEAGIIVSDLPLSASRYRCAECGGRGTDEVGEAACRVCGGALYDWRVSELPLLGRSVGEILRAPLTELADLPWTSERMQRVLESLPHALVPGLSLSGTCRPLSPLVVDCARLYSRLATLGAPVGARSKAPKRLDGELVLIDGPRAIPPSWFAELAPLFTRCIERGATIVYAGAPETLESSCVSVIRLRVGGRVTSGREEFLDTRYARLTNAIPS